MITEDKVIELFCMADDFCKSFDAMMIKYALKSTTKRRYHRASTMSTITYNSSNPRCISSGGVFIEDAPPPCFHAFQLCVNASAMALWIEMQVE